MSRTSVLARKIDGTKLIFTVIGTGETIEVETTEFSDTIRAQAEIYGFNTKIGRTAAGMSGDEAAKAIKQVIAGLHADNWLVKAAAKPPKLSESILKERMLAATPEVRAGAIEMLGDEYNFEKMGFNVDGTECPVAEVAEVQTEDQSEEEAEEN